MFNFLRKKKQSQEPLVSIEFSVNAESQIELETKWSGYSEYNAKILGRLLYLIHSGSLVPQHVNLLNSYVKDDPSSGAFIGAAVEQWAQLKKEVEKNDDEPLISPDSFMSSDKDKEEDSE